MKLLSLTFHVTSSNLEKWTVFVEEKLKLEFEKLKFANKFVFSEVESEMLNEGKNFNLLLYFDDEVLYKTFLQEEVQEIASLIEDQFHTDVILFISHLTPISSNF